MKIPIGPALSPLIFLLVLCPLKAMAEDVTVSTFYPSPYGNYGDLEVTGNTYLATRSGQVGIGTVSPTAPLTVYSDQGSYGQIRIINTDPASNKESSIAFRGQGDADNLSWIVGKNLEEHLSNGGTADSLALYQGGVTQMVLSPAGMLGLGSYAPAQPLDIRRANPKIVLQDTDADPATYPTLGFRGAGEYVIEGDETPVGGALDPVIWHFYSKDKGTFPRNVDTEIRVHGSAGASMGVYIGMKHDGTNGVISTDAGHIILTPQSGKSVEILEPGQVPLPTGLLNVIDENTTTMGDIVISDSNSIRFVSPASGVTRTAIGSGSDGSLRFFTGSAMTERMRITSTGNVGIGTSAPTYKLHVNGSAAQVGGGEWHVLSDIRVKRNIRHLEGALDKMLRLKGVTFEWKEPEKRGERTGVQMGMIAQDVEKVFPEWVGTDPDGFKDLTVRGFTALTVEAIRELKIQNDTLRRKHEQLKNKVETLELRLKKKLESQQGALSDSGMPGKTLPIRSPQARSSS